MWNFERDVELVFEGQWMLDNTSNTLTHLLKTLDIFEYIIIYLEFIDEIPT